MVGKMRNAEYSNSGRERSRRFRYSGVYATDTRKRQTCKGLRSTVIVNAIRTSDLEIVQSIGLLYT